MCFHIHAYWALGVLTSIFAIFGLVQCALAPICFFFADWYAGSFGLCLAEIMGFGTVHVSNRERSLVWPSPASNLGDIGPVFVSVVPACNLHVAEAFYGVRSNRLQPRNTLDYVYCQAEAVDFVHDR